MKELERFKDVEDVKEQLNKMEKSLQKYGKENMEQKVKKFTRDILDYQYGQVYTFSKKYDSLRSKGKLETSKSRFLSDNSSDPGCSADEAVEEKIDFQKELCLVRMTTHQGGRIGQQKGLEEEIWDKEGQGKEDKERTGGDKRTD
ncbi:hypothetical protein NDU88_004058 [Pleurodeles waltl]|uniref:Uncharacterized protein n=1 Tax=Pleurodeles waltl TaxID=8319 RepID=A0AAV7WU88_PLEWA|nr:hypothetical protein NDU88_004058 [Pleurodeles waltl]